MRRWCRRLLLLALLALQLNCSPLAVVNGLTPDGAAEVWLDRAYGANPRQQLDVYWPGTRRSGSPVLVFFYGGSWRSGDRSDYSFVGDTLASLGYVTVIPDYRLYPEVTFPAFVRDGADALAWVQRELGEAKEGTVLLGHSAGAHIAALLALDERYLDAKGFPQAGLRGWIGLAGPYAFDPLAYKRTRPVFEGHDTPGDARPVNFACRRKVPALLLHGESDSTVLPRNSEDLAQALSRCGALAGLQLMPSVNHFDILLGLSPSLEGLAPVLPAITEFLETL